MSKKGWIKLHRKIYDNWLWKNDKPFDKRAAWIDILLMVNHKKNKILFDNELIEVAPGERITSERKLSERWGWSRTKVRNFLKLLQDDDMLKVNKTTKKTTLKVVNYNKYQVRETTKRTTEVPEKDQASTRRVPGEDTNKNDKNDKNDKENLYTQEIEDILDCWNNLLSDINNVQGTKRQREKIKTKLDRWNKENILQAIRNYNEAYRAEWYYNHNWTLYKFVESGKGIPRFKPGLDDKYDGDLWKDYQEWQSNNSVGQTDSEVVYG